MLIKQARIDKMLLTRSLTVVLLACIANVSMAGGEPQAVSGGTPARTRPALRHKKGSKIVSCGTPLSHKQVAFLWF